MNYTLKEKSERTFAADKNGKSRGYIDELDDGNHLVLCGFNKGRFNESLYNAIKPHIVAKEKRELWEGVVAYFYNIDTENVESLEFDEYTY